MPFTFSLRRARTGTIRTTQQSPSTTGPGLSQAPTCNPNCASLASLASNLDKDRGRFHSPRVGDSRLCILHIPQFTCPHPKVPIPVTHHRPLPGCSNGPRIQVHQTQVLLHLLHHGAAGITTASKIRTRSFTVVLFPPTQLTTGHGRFRCQSIRPRRHKRRQQTREPTASPPSRLRPCLFSPAISNIANSRLFLHEACLELITINKIPSNATRTTATGTSTPTKPSLVSPPPSPVVTNPSRA